MKKLLCVLLVISVLFSLWGCGDAAKNVGTESKSSAVSSSEVASAETSSTKQDHTDFSYDFAVSVSIPATFTLYLDSAMNIAAVKDNDDAAKFVAQLDVAGKSYDEGMKTILNAALELGLLLERGEVVFSIPCEVFLPQLLGDLCTPVDQLWADGEVHLTIDMNIIPEETPELTSTDFFGIQEEEINGQAIYINKWDFAHPGNGVLYTYYGFHNEYPNPMVYTDGTLLGSMVDRIRYKLISFAENGDWNSTYIEDGRQDRYVSCYDGRLTAGEYVDSGANIYFSKEVDGSYSFTESENGTFVTSRYKHSDGWYCVDTYENSIVVASYSLSPDGSLSTFTYDANGVPTGSYYESPDGTVSGFTYDINGILINVYSKAPDGYMTQQTYYPSGNIHISEEWTNGEHRVCTYAEDGSLIDYLQEAWDETAPDIG